MAFINHFFGFEGRINRATWWLTSLFMGLVNLVTELILKGVMTRILGEARAEMAQLAASLLTSLILLYPVIAIAAKRLHDRNHSGWRQAWFMAPGLLLVLIVPMMLVSGNEDTGAGLAGTALLLIALTLIAVIWSIVELGFLNGTDGDNDFGPPRRLADLFVVPESDGAWANSDSITAAVAGRSAETSGSTQTGPLLDAAGKSSPVRGTAKTTTTRPAGFGRRPAHAR